MKKISFLLFIAFLISDIAPAQKKMLTIDEATIGAYRQYKPENLIQSKWRYDDVNYTFIKDYTKIMQANINSDMPQALVDLETVNKKLNEKNQGQLAYFYDYSWLDFNNVLFENQQNAVIYDIENKTVKLAVSAPENSENHKFCKENKLMAYTKENNLFFRNSEGDETSVTNFSDKNIVCGTSVSRNEFGISHGIFWSPKGNFLAFFKKNEDDVTDYPLVDVTARVAQLKNTKYPMAGESSENVALGVFNLANGKTTWIEDEVDSEKYLTCITWSPDEKNIYIAVLNREQNHMKLNKYDALSGKLIKTLFEEKHEKYVEPEHDLIFMNKNTNQFIWQSERDGYNHLYLYDTEGSFIKQLTQGNWVVTEVLGIDADDKFLYYVSTEVSPLERHLYSLDLKKGKTTKISQTEGMHEFAISKNFKYILDSYSNTKTPNKTDILETTGKLVKNILTAKNPLTNVQMPEMELVTIKSADGKTDLHGRLIKPLNYKSGKKYPVVLYVYGGPHTQMVTNSWLAGTGLWDYYMAQNDYVMFTLDNRGSSDRGLEFENVIHRECGQNEMQDQMKGIEYLKSLPYVDAKRIGVHGWSYGGFMTITLLINYPETFKVGVAGGPVIDWKFYEVMYGERYMDMPQENPEGYKKTSLLENAGKLNSQLLVIEGYLDATVVPQNSLEFLRATESENILIDFYTYPTHEHNVMGKDRIHLMKKITKYFDDFLK